MCISCLWPLLGSTVYHYLFYRMHLGWPFLIFLFLLLSLFKKVLPAFGVNHIFESRPTPLCIKNATFWTPRRRARRLFSSLWPFLSLLCSFGSVFFFAPWAYQKSHYGPRLVHFQPPEPIQQKPLYASHLLSYGIRMPSAVFCCVFNALHTLSFIMLSIFLKNAPRWES